MEKRKLYQPNDSEPEKTSSEPKWINVKSKPVISDYDLNLADYELIAHNASSCDSRNFSNNLPNWCRKIKTLKTARVLIGVTIFIGFHDAKKYEETKAQYTSSLCNENCLKGSILKLGLTLFSNKIF